MKKMSLSTKTLIGFIVGIVLGLVLQEQASILKPIGDLFLNLIRMIVVPLVLFSICTGVSNMSDVKKLRRVGSKILSMYVVTTVISAFIGLGVAHLINPGIGFVMDAAANGQQYKAAEVPSFINTLVGMVPVNPIQAMSNGAMIQIIVFAVFWGVALTILGEKTATMKRFFDDGTEIIYKITAMVMEISPYGTCALIAVSVGNYGTKIVGPLGKLILADYVSMFIIVFVMYPIILRFMGKFSVSYFFRKIVALWAITASTTSSSGSLPVTSRITQEDFKVSEEIAGFSLPLGATINMNAGGGYFAIAVVFVSQIYGVDLSLTQQLMIVMLSTIVSVGSPGIPGGGIVMTIMLLTTMGLPIDVIGMIAGIYKIIDIGHTTVNCTGDVVSTIAVARSENMINDEYAKNSPQTV